jgi:hypothetical protein
MAVKLGFTINGLPFYQNEPIRRYRVKKRKIEMDFKTETFIVSLGTVSKDLALWASMEIMRGATVDDVKARLAAAYNVVNTDRSR